MRQGEIFPTYRKYAKEYEQVYEYLKSQYNETYVEELCAYRGYVGEDQINMIRNNEFGYCTIEDIRDLTKHASELGLVSKTGDFILNNRFIMPVRDICSNIVALVGYYPDLKGYITTPSTFFSKDCMLYNIDRALVISYSKFNGLVFLVEGMFDTASLDGIGLPAVGAMGASVTRAKCELLKLFKKVVYIPDNDKTGRRCLDRYDKKYGWQVPRNATALEIKGGLLENGLFVKDMDDFVSYFDKDDVIDTLLSVAESCNQKETLIL